MAYSVATILKALRAQTGFTQDYLERLSILLGDRITQQQIQRWEAGIDRPQTRSLQRIAKLYTAALHDAGLTGVDADRLFAQLLAASRAKPAASGVSEQAAMLDLWISTHSTNNQDLFWLLIDHLMAWFDEARRRATARQRDTTENNPDET